jgi:hypothetical protein
VDAVRRIVVVVALAISVAIPAVAEARQFLTFGEARTEVQDIIRTEMKRAGGTYEEGSASVGCWRAPTRLTDRASCIATWSTADGTSYCGTARIVEHRTFYAQDLTWRAGTYPQGHQCASVPRALRPKLGVSVVVVPMAGQVRVKAKGARGFVALRRAGRIRVGSTVDAARGRVRLITASDARGSTQSGVFDGGAFVVTQERTPPGLTDLSLVGGRANPCGKGAARPLRAGAHQSLRSRVIRSLRGHARGRFRTRGRYSAATVRGTVWLTEDTCDGTNVTDRSGVVDAATGAGQGFTLNPGQSAIFYCFPPGSAFKAPDYCIAVLSQPADGLFAFGLGTHSTAPTYQVCVATPSGANRCGEFPLGAPNANGVRIAGLVCTQFEGPGTYVARWFIGGQQVGVPLPFTATIPQPATQQCIHQP